MTKRKVRRKLGSIQDGRIYLGKRTADKLITLLLTAYAEDADQQARNLLIGCWPQIPWDQFVRDELHCGPLMCLPKP